MGKKEGAPPMGGYAPPGSKKSTDYGPPPSDPFALAGWAQNINRQGTATPYQQAAEATSQANRPNQNTPFASTSWTTDPNTGLQTQNTSLAGPLGDAAKGLSSQFASSWASPLDNGAQARQHAEDAIYGRATARLDPMWGQREHDLTTTLANQGIDPNSAAYGKSLDNFGRSRNDAYSSALMDAITGGGQEAQRQQGMDLQSRMAPLQAMGGLQSMTQMPGFQAGPNYLAATGMANDYNLQKNQQDNQWWADLLNGGSRIGAAVAGKP